MRRRLARGRAPRHPRRVHRLAPIVLAAAALALAGMNCRAGKSVLDNATGGALRVEVVCDDGWTFAGEVVTQLWFSMEGSLRRLERLEIRRADGTVQRFDRARLELLAEGIPNRDEVAWVVEAEDFRALALDAWVSLQNGKGRR
jgi:hypothetical protein